jgi:hypothetical protein
MTPPASLGRGLGRSFAVATVIGMVVFAVVQALIIYVTEIGEECAPGVPEDPPAEIFEQCAVALAIAAPFGVVLSLKLGRRLTNPTTARLDEVIVSAKRMTASGSTSGCRSAPTATRSIGCRWRSTTCWRGSSAGSRRSSSSRPTRRTSCARRSR